MPKQQHESTSSGTEEEVQYSDESEPEPFDWSTITTAPDRDPNESESSSEERWDLILGQLEYPWRAGRTMFDLRIPKGWERVFIRARDTLWDIQKQLLKMEKRTKSLAFYPKKRDLFRAFQKCPLHKVKVMIIGQDPYHSNEDQAMGMAFSVRKGVKIPPSLVNIFKEVKDCVKGFHIPKSGDLTAWAEQGVLLLNSCLTVQPGKANSHKNIGWKSFIKEVLKELAEHRPRTIYLLWGASAQEVGSQIDVASDYKLECAHPSPMSANSGFFGCGHFRKVNEIITESNYKRRKQISAGKVKPTREIDWTL